MYSGSNNGTMYIEPRKPFHPLAPYELSYAVFMYVVLSSVYMLELHIAFFMHKVPSAGNRMLFPLLIPYIESVPFCFFL